MYLPVVGLCHSGDRHRRKKTIGKAGDHTQQVQTSGQIIDNGQWVFASFQQERRIFTQYKIPIEYRQFIVGKLLKNTTEARCRKSRLYPFAVYVHARTEHQHDPRGIRHVLIVHANADPPLDHVYLQDRLVLYGIDRAVLAVRYPVFGIVCFYKSTFKSRHVPFHIICHFVGRAADLIAVCFIVHDRAVHSGHSGFFPKLSDTVLLLGLIRNSYCFCPVILFFQLDQLDRRPLAILFFLERSPYTLRPVFLFKVDVPFLFDGYFRVDIDEFDDIRLLQLPV